jgi:hypothetical protein
VAPTVASRAQTSGALPVGGATGRGERRKRSADDRKVEEEAVPANPCSGEREETTPIEVYGPPPGPKNEVWREDLGAHPNLRA